MVIDFDNLKSGQHQGARYQDIRHQDLGSSTMKPLKRKKRGWLGCLSIFIIFVLIIFLLLLKSGYLQVISDLFQITGNTIKQTKVEQTLKYKYNTSNTFTNILILGSDSDAKFNPNQLLTQTMMIASINPSTKKFYLISIPRDFWIKIPGYTLNGGYSKFDTVSEIGGIQLTRQVVEQYFGIKINYYAWIGLNGFINVINKFGGVYVTPTHPVMDWAYPNDLTGNPQLINNLINLYISPAPQYMNGFRTLEYVRSRHGDLQGDFGRAKRQQQILTILKKKLETTTTISAIPSLFNSLTQYVRTDMTIPDIISLAGMAKDMGSTPIQSIILSPPKYSSLSTTTNYDSTTGQYITQDIVKPNWAAINNLFSKLYGN